jgi:cytidylate kinase
MSNESSLSLPELNDRIAILQDNIRQLVEQAAGASGERNEERVAERLSTQNEELDRLIKERDNRDGGSTHTPIPLAPLIFSIPCRY